MKFPDTRGRRGEENPSGVERKREFRKTSGRRIGMNIKDVYPIWKWSMLSWVIVGLVPLALLVATIYSAADNDPKGVAIAIISCLTLAGICTTALVFQILARVSLRKKVAGFNVYRRWGKKTKTSAPVAFLLDGVDDREASQFISRLVESDALISDIEKKLLYSTWRFVVSGKAWTPVTFVAFKKPGQVTRRLLSGVVQRCRGIQRGQWCEVEWDRDVLVTLSVVRHELAHVAISMTAPGMNESKQHRLMGVAGIR